MAEPFIHIIIQYCNDARPQRQAEYDECVRRNLAHPFVKAVHNLVEPKTTVPQELRSHSKYVEKRLERWMTYKDALDYAGATLSGEVICISNLDIFLDPECDWSPLRQWLSDNRQIVLCQARWEFDPAGPRYKDPQLEKLAFCNSQDAWFFLAPLEVANCDFEIGTLGCDNAFAHRVKTSGRTPLNAQDQLPILHYDRARGKTFENQIRVHLDERGQERYTRHPDREGHYLVPNCDQVPNLDSVLDSMNLSPLDRYMIICDVMSKYLNASNE